MSLRVSTSLARLSVEPLPSIETDLLVVPIFEGETRAPIDGLDGAAAGEISRALASGEAAGRPFELFFTPLVRDWKARRVALAGAGKAQTYDLERLRRLATAAALAARQRRLTRIAFVLRRPDRGPVGFTDPQAAQAVAEGLMAGAYNAGLYKTADRGGPPPTDLVVAAHAADSAGALAAAVERGAVLGESVNIAKHLCDEPSNVLTPRVFADRAAAIARDAGLSVQILDEQAIAQMRMGLLLGVARGSAEPPRVIVLRHDPPSAPAAPVLGLVGKGITFDTGGISIKPADGMERMKDDMAGGAAVICAMRAISLLGAPIRVVAVVPTTENMPGGRAIKPGDVLTGASGKTVEVINTDAEGRLILGDGLWYAQELGATHLVDVATLTGACVVALGKAASGLFGTPDDWRDLVEQTALTAGDRCWPLPLYDEYTDQIRSDVADIMNSGGRPAGACTAAMFLKEFAGDRSWCHLDIAGTAWAEDGKPYLAKGATGVAVRTLAELAFSADRYPAVPAGSIQ
ncbi:MAG TPA: leucyl aminopeptidase [Vicinamibacterales bacterium]|nr:leucyl aminopeptidase [Vicinamibacterales bacterium]